METFYLERHSEHLSFYNKSLDREKVIIFGGPQGLPGDSLCGNSSEEKKQIFHVASQQHASILAAWRLLNVDEVTSTHLNP